MNKLFKIITSTIFPYEGEQYMYGIIDDIEIAFLFERNIPIIRIRNKLGDNKEISIDLIEKTLKEATPAPWKWLQFNREFGANCYIVPEDEKVETHPLVIAEVNHGWSTCDLIANGPVWLQFLIDKVHLLEKENAQLKFKADEKE